MRFSPIHQIKWKLTLVILGTCSVVLVLGTVAIQIYDAVTSQANLLSQVDTMAEITAANSSSAVAFPFAREAQEALDVLRTRSEIDLACLYLNDGKPLAYFATNGMTLAALPALPRAEDHVFNNGRLILKRKVFLREEPVGSIVICANLKRQTARSHTFLFISLVCFFGLLGIVLLLATRLQHLVSDPIAQLAKAANHITTHKDYSVRVPNPMPDEIGSLVIAFNQMLSEIDRQNRSLVASENRLKLALSASKMGAWEWNLQTDRVSWSNENNRIYGNPEPETNLAAFTRQIHPDDADAVVSALKQSAEKQVPFTSEYRVNTPEGPTHWVAHHGQVRCDANGRPAVLAGIVQDISSRKQSEADHQQLIAKLLHAEEDERRRIARELHDTTTQHLAALKMNFSRLGHDRPTRFDTKLLTECRQLLDQALQEVRTLAYVLHPPVLEEFGLVGTLKDFASGVSRRSGVQVMVHTGEYEGRLPRNVELTLFRVVQESVANAIRHSGTKEISIRLARDSQEARVEIQDFGRGFPAGLTSPRTSGVGIAAMQERLTLIGGMLNVESDSEGVTVLASAPVATEYSPHISRATTGMNHEP